MKEKKTFAQSLAHKVAQIVVRREIYGWPPDSNWGIYQPRRPEPQKLQPQKMNPKDNT